MGGDPKYVTSFLSAVERLSGQNVSMPGVLRSIIVTMQALSRPVIDWTSRQLQEKSERKTCERALDFTARIAMIKEEKDREADRDRLLLFVFCTMAGVAAGLLLSLFCMGAGG